MSVRTICLTLLFLVGASLRADDAPELPEDFAELSADVQSVILEFMFFPEQANKVWGDDLSMPGPHTLVKYLDDYHTRVTIDFEKGRIDVETRGHDNPVATLRHGIEATLLTPADPTAVDLFTAADFGLTGKPFLAGKVLDQEGKAIEYPWRAQRFSRYLTEQKLQRRGNRYWISIPMVGEYKAISARGYENEVRAAAQKYGVAPALILAVIETESSFNPFAVSPARAYGLMQVMQATAGKDVYQKIYRRSDAPSRKTLLTPAHNIDIGTAYLSILRDRYLRGIAGDARKEYCVIAAYNGGAGNLFKAFGGSPKQAIARINALSAREVYDRIVRYHPKKESRDYLKKVTRAKQRYL